MLLKYAKIEKKTETLLKLEAEGKEFKNTALIGQLPLTVAALMIKEQDCVDKERLKTFVHRASWIKESDSNRRKILETLLAEGACIWEKNSLGDTVFHSLIKYGNINPDKILHIKAAFTYAWMIFRNEASEKSDSNPNITDILFWENKEGLTPLELSVKLGVGEIFDCIINLSGVYCFQNVQNGLFDIRVYDVTEFDRLIYYFEQQKSERNSGEKKKQKSNQQDKSKTNSGTIIKQTFTEQNNSKRNSGKRMKQKSEEQDKSNRKTGKITILERLFDSQCSQEEAFGILNQEVVRYILQTKWNTYRIPLFIWLIIHTIFISFTTLVTVQKSESYLICRKNSTFCELTKSVDAIGVTYLLIGIIYLVFSFLVLHQLAVRLHNGGRGLLLHNLDYIICLIVMSIGAMVESVLSFLRLHLDYHIVFLLLCGWYFMFFFSPFQKNIVTFTYMIKSGLVKDFTPFFLIFLFLLVSFTAAMQLLFRGENEHPEEFDIFRDSLLTMFKLGIGLNDIGVLNQSRIPGFAYILFILFVILCFIHLLNALIAVMSQTFSDVHRERNSYFWYQKLCMIEFFEDIVLASYFQKFVLLLEKDIKYWTERKIKYGPSDKQRRSRYRAKIHSLDDSFYNRDDKEERKKSGHDVPNLNDVIQNENNVNSEQEVMNYQDVTFVRFLEKIDRSSQFPEVQHSST